MDFHITNISRKMDTITNNSLNFPFKHNLCRVLRGNFQISLEGQHQDVLLRFTYGFITYVMLHKHNMEEVMGHRISINAPIAVYAIMQYFRVLYIYILNKYNIMHEDTH